MEIKKELTASGVKLNVILIPFIAALCIGMAELYGFFWESIYDYECSTMAAVIIIIIAVVVHEALHGFTWMLAGNLKLSDIKYGIMWKALMPFAHSKKPLSKRAYQLGGMMPGIVLGIIPYGLGLAFGQTELAFFGMIMTLCAGGDAWILWVIRKEPVDALILDHPSKAGCYVVAPAVDSASIATSSVA